MSSSNIRDAPVDTYNKSPVNNKNTAAKARYVTNHAVKYLATKNLAASKDLALCDENRGALLAFYKNSLPPRVSTPDGNRDAMLAFYRCYGNRKKDARNTFNE